MTLAATVVLLWRESLLWLAGAAFVLGLLAVATFPALAHRGRLSRPARRQ